MKDTINRIGSLIIPIIVKQLTSFSYHNFGILRKRKSNIQLNIMIDHIIHSRVSMFKVGTVPLCRLNSCIVYPSDHLHGQNIYEEWIIDTLEINHLFEAPRTFGMSLRVGGGRMGGKALSLEVLW